MMNDPEYSQIKGLIKQYANQAEKSLKEGQSYAALASINLAINVDPGSIASARAYCIRAEIYETIRDFNSAMRDIETAINLNPRYDRLYWTRAAILIDLKRVDDAVRDFDTFLAMNKGGDHAVFLKIGNVFHDRNEYGHAILYYAKSIEAGGTQPLVYAKRALAYRGAGKLPESEKDRETAGLPEWFYDINPMFHAAVASHLKVNLVHYIPPENVMAKRNNAGGGVVVFGPRMAERAFDAKTGKYLWRS